MPPNRLTCRELADFLSVYLEGALERGIRERFEAHLAKCPDCVAYLTSYRETVHLARACLFPSEPPPEDAPPELVAAILAACGRARGRRPRS